MRQTVIQLTCDACAAWKHRETVEGVETVPTAGGHTLDLCESHRDGMRAVLGLMAEWGASPSGRRSRPAARTLTPAPELVEAVPAPSNGGKRTRRGGVRERARKATAAAVATDVLACPLCGRESPTTGAAGMHLRDVHGLTSGAVYGAVCPLCGAEGTARGLGVHGLRAHEASGVAVLFARARAEGDPLGVVAARAAAVAQLAAATPV